MSSQLSPTVSHSGANPNSNPKQQQQQQRQFHPPITVLSTPAAQVYSHLHPLLIISLYGFRFHALVQDPVTTLWTLLPVVAALQSLYVMFCLPAAGGTIGASGSGGSDKARSGKGGLKRKKSEAEGSLSRKVVPTLLSLALPLLLGTPFMVLLLVLFGAPATTHIWQTILCAAHMAILSGTSMVYAHGTDGTVWREIWGISRAVDTVWGATVGMALGAWLGAIPIPLDWDRPWQAYPITIITGAYIGYALGCCTGRTPLLYGRRIRFNAEDEETVEVGKGGDKE